LGIGADDRRIDVIEFVAIADALKLDPAELLRESFRRS
jgi:hypothetical protein